MKIKIVFLLNITTLLLMSGVFANTAQSQQRLQSIFNEPPSGIDSNVWRGALTSYLSQCANGGADCKCALVIAQGIEGDVASATMWVGTLRGGSPIMLWTGYASRFAVAHQNTTSVNMPTDRCKRRNGVATVTGDQACIPGRRCRDASVYRAIVADLGLPPTVALTAFYFSTPMQNELYKFHDFVACNNPPCPRTLGCLGLERHAMRSLCLNHMGSDGSNGIDSPERGGVWLYFHNNNAPQAQGSEAEAAQGLENFTNGSVCSDTSTANLSSGELTVPDSSFGSLSGDNSASSGQYYNSNGQSPIDSAINAGELSPEEVGDSRDNEDDELVRKIVDSCQSTVSESCPNVEESVIREYCANQSAFNRGSCAFERVDEESEEEQE